jgi:hypothetical protein
MPNKVRLFQTTSMTMLSVVPLYLGFKFAHHVIAGFPWPGLSPYFWALWFVIAVGLTIAHAPSQELRDDRFSKTGFALGAVNIVTAFIAVLYSSH